MPTEMIVRNCAPTLAGLKVGNLFCFPYGDMNALIRSVKARNHLLNPKGVYFVIMRLRNGVAMIYVYRRKQLEQVLARPEVQAFLRQFGYNDFGIGRCLTVLRKRLLMEDFPHDIGVFLGYPLADIKAFIVNKGANCSCTGCWKAYTNINQAKETFRQFKKCTRIYCQRFDEGFDITRLTVAG